VNDDQELSLGDFQRHIAEKYLAVDRERGTAATWLWFSEEIGELARALARQNDRANLEEEFADVIAWLCTLANINGVDLAAAVRRKYLGERPPQGHK
jgi:NTP pyrophosphatase (non-canonical NTP hydrolase)